MVTDEKDRLGQKLKDVERAKEDLYFAEQDRKLIEKMRKAKAEEMEAHIRQLAHMRCPKCGARLQHVMERGVAVEECPECHGIWLDHGELEQIAGQEQEGWFARWLRGEFRRPTS
jgi:rubrerythrin